MYMAKKISVGWMEGTLEKISYSEQCDHVVTPGHFQSCTKRFQTVGPATSDSGCISTLTTSHFWRQELILYHLCSPWAQPRADAQNTQLEGIC